jgi:two-component system sensor histidine kinase/response regulator
VLGHDLRNPLSAITTGASLLARRADSERVSKPALRIVKSAGRMARMIDQVLDFTRIRLGEGLPLECKDTDLGEVCRIALDELEAPVQGAGLELRIVGDVVGYWDEDRLTQLISNLAGNALAHGSPPMVIEVNGTDDAQVTMQVTNAGAIAADVLPLVFEPFRSTANRKHERSSGLGLGLYISQQLVHSHAGTIEVACPGGESSQFTVRLPRGPRSSR